MQDLGRRFDDDTLVALGQFFEGRARIKQARVDEGLSLLDEAMLAALSDNLKPMWTGAIYCGLLGACNELADLRRAREWTEATRRWCDPLPLASLYPGICRVHWAEVLDVRGEWEEAEREALAASESMLGIDVFAVADGWFVVGEVRRHRGDLDGADEAYAKASEIGRDPQPGLALLRLAQGRVRRGLGSIAAAIAGFGGSDPERAPLLCAQAQIALIAGDVDLATKAADRGARGGARYESTGLRAAGSAVPRRRGAGPGRDGRGARVAPRRADRLAGARRALRGRSHAGARRRRLRPARRPRRRRPRAAAARACFERLARRPSSRPRPVAGGAERPDTHGLTARELEVLALVAPAEQPGARRRAGDQREDGGPAPRQHLREARRVVASAATAFAFRTTCSRTTDLPAPAPSARNVHPGQERCTRRPMCRGARSRTFLPHQPPPMEEPMPMFVIERNLPGAGSLSSTSRTPCPRSPTRSSPAWRPGPVAAQLRHRRQALLRLRRRGCRRRPEHAECGGFPADAVLQVGTIIDPTTGE